MSTKLKTLYAYIAFVILYGAGTLLIPPPDKTLHRYHITSLHLKALDLTIIILYAAIWLCAVYGFYNLRHYYQLIKKNKDGKALDKITIGIGFLAFWLPITAVYNTYSNFLAQHHANLAALIAVSQNYLSLLMPLVGFIFIGIGARRLSELAKQRASYIGMNILVIVLILIGTAYVRLVSDTHNRLNGIYHLSTWCILLTLVAPYIYMWFLGFLSFYEIYLYRSKIAGIVYRSSWRLLAFGIGSLIIVSIIIQYLSTISERLNKLSLSWVLMVIYALLILVAVAYVLIALGVRNLKRIEEV